VLPMLFRRHVYSNWYFRHVEAIEGVVLSRAGGLSRMRETPGQEEKKMRHLHADKKSHNQEVLLVIHGEGIRSV
jgi:hypothetical protein